MTESITVSARFEDLLLIVTRDENAWRARVEEGNDPTSALSDGGLYASSDRAKAAAVSIALELFGTIVPPDELRWHWSNEHDSSQPDP